jgi:hypothetical protein
MIETIQKKVLTCFCISGHILVVVNIRYGASLTTFQRYSTAYFVGTKYISHHEGIL